MTGNRESARYVLAYIDYLRYIVSVHEMYYKIRICRTDISEAQLQYLYELLKEKRLQLRIQENHLMYF